MKIRSHPCVARHYCNRRRPTDIQIPQERRRWSFVPLREPTRTLSTSRPRSHSASSLPERPAHRPARYTGGHPRMFGTFPSSMEPLRHTAPLDRSQTRASPTPHAPPPHQTPPTTHENPLHHEDRRDSPDQTDPTSHTQKACPKYPTPGDRLSPEDHPTYATALPSHRPPPETGALPASPRLLAALHPDSGHSPRLHQLPRRVKQIMSSLTAIKIGPNLTHPLALGSAQQIARLDRRGRPPTTLVIGLKHAPPWP
ncbi:hypothetical protein LY13_003242 [Prauserella aidingensis]|nr:hypothetical protein [Prauserella aidingensis]